MPHSFQIIEVPADVHREQEQMGTKFKFWYEDGQHGYCLFKEGHPNTGEDWAEKIAAALCEPLELPHAVYKLAVWRDKHGVITPNFLAADESLVPGNEVLFGRDESYPREQRYKVRQHNLKNIFTTFEPLQVQLPRETAPPEITTAQQIFLGYLMLDAWIGNTDRHHENWALIQHSENGVVTYRLAPTHDHAASLGCTLRDEERHERLTTKDQNRTVAAYAQSTKARSAIYADEDNTRPLPLLDAFRLASSYNRQNREAAKIWKARLGNVTMAQLQEVFARLPAERISNWGKEFALQMLATNRQRLLAD